MCVISWFGRICLPHVQRIVSSNTACPREGHWWILEVLNSMGSTFHMSWTTWVDSWLNSMLSFARSSRIQKFFEPFFNSFNILIIRVLTWTCTRSDVDIISVALILWRQKDCSQLPGAWSTSRMCFEPSWTSGKSSLFLPFFQKLGTSVPEVECCCWHC